MLKRFTPYFIVVFFIVSCYKFKEPEKPKNLISKAEMVNILIDLRIVSSIYGQDLKVLDSHNIKVENYIYKKYNIDSTQFASSNNYYAYYVEDYEDIYTRVKDSLERLSKFYKDLEAEELKQKKKEDSLKLLAEKDTLKLKIKDSLQLIAKKDSIKNLKTEMELKKKLIKPASSTNSPPR